MIKCGVCGHEFRPIISEHYIARDNGKTGIATVLQNNEEKFYDAFDCSLCGCQVIAQERKRAIPHINFEIEEDE